MRDESLVVANAMAESVVNGTAATEVETGSGAEAGRTKGWFGPEYSRLLGTWLRRSYRPVPLVRDVSPSVMRTPKKVIGLEC
jgi:hypothetical protein